MESNISRDHIALEVLKIVIDKTLMTGITPVNRIRRWLGLNFYITSTFMHNTETMASMSYKIADAMIEERRKNEGA